MLIICRCQTDADANRSHRLIQLLVEPEVTSEEGSVGLNATLYRAQGPSRFANQGLVHLVEHLRTESGI